MRRGERDLERATISKGTSQGSLKTTHGLHLAGHERVRVDADEDAHHDDSHGDDVVEERRLFNGVASARHQPQALKPRGRLGRVGHRVGKTAIDQLRQLRPKEKKEKIMRRWKEQRKQRWAFV